MEKIIINLNSVDKVKAFVNTVINYDGDVDLISGRYVVDGKSIMGIFSLDLSKPLEVQFHEGGTPVEEEVKKIAAFIVDSKPEAEE